MEMYGIKINKIFLHIFKGCKVLFAINNKAKIKEVDEKILDMGRSEDQSKCTENELVWGDREKIRRRLILREISFNETDWLNFQHKLQEVVVEYFIEKFKDKHQFQSINAQKQLLLKQQFKIAEELKGILLIHRSNTSRQAEGAEQRKEQIKDFAEALYDKHTFKQLLSAAELKVTSEQRETTRSYKSVFDKSELQRKKDELEEELKLIKTILDIQ